jgi:hypothetical protein
VNTLLVAAGTATADSPETATTEDWRRDMSVGHRLPGGRVIVHAPVARWCDLCESQRD